MHPILFHIGAIPIRAYGVMIALAFVIATLLAAREARRVGLDPEIVYDFLLYTMVSGVLGARLYFILASDPMWFLRHPADWLAIWKGGLSVHGGLIGGLLAGLWFSRRRRLAFWSFADLLTPSIIIGQAVGRGACTLNGCSYGRPTNLPWAITFTDPDAQAPLGVPLHPTQFYEMGTDFLILAMIWVIRKKKRFDGQIFLVYWMLYGAARFVLEFFRGDSLRALGGFAVPQLASVVVLLLAGSLYAFRSRDATTRTENPAAPG